MKPKQKDERCVSVRSSGKAVPNDVKQELLMVCIYNIINSVSENSKKERSYCNEQ